MLYFAAIGIAIIAIARLFLPARHLVHAARVTRVRGRSVRDRLKVARPIYDETGERLFLADKFVGRAYGGSMLDYSIPHDSTFIATRLSDEDRKTLVAGELVVIDAPTNRSKTGLRLRCIEEIHGDVVRFMVDQYGKDHQERPLKTVIARVTHVIEDKRPLSKTERAMHAQVA